VTADTPGKSDATLLPIMRTDITVEHPPSNRCIVIETKFTDALVDYGGKTTIKSAYLYQLYAYLMSQTGRGSTALDNAEGVLMFVKTDDRDLFTDEVRIQGHQLRFLSVDLSQEPAQIRQRWMQSIGLRLDDSGPPTPVDAKP
jgi:5-methylcytosine-specific restriction enzyme subunit McrC